MTVAYLTVDDAPSETLPETLSVLEELDVPALLFCEGQRLDAYPDRARLAVEAGVHLGNHAYSHTHASELSVSTFRDELERTDALIESVYDDADATRPAKLFRFPYGDDGGARSEQFQAVLDEMGFDSVDHTRIDYEWYQEGHAGRRDWFWTINVEDWNADTEATLRENVEGWADRFRTDTPDIVLFHDQHNGPELFEVLVDAVRAYDVRFADPLDLVA